MTREFELPDVGEGVAEGELLEWLVEAGDAVSEDQPVAEVETDKAVVEVPSPVNGSVRELHAEPGAVIPVGTVIVTFDVDGEEEAGENGDTTTEEASDATRTEDGSEPSSVTTSDAPTGPETGVGTPDGRVFAAPSVRRLARELGVAIERAASADGRVSAAEVRAAANGTGATGATLEDDRAGSATTDAAESDTPATGSDGSIAAAETSGAEPDEREPDLEDTATTRPDGSRSADRERTLAAPATRRIAAEAGVDIDSVPASEERDGEAFVTPAAIEAYADAQQRANAADAETQAEAVAGESIGAESAREERVAYRGIRRTIGEQMEQSAFTAPHVTHHDTVDVTELVAARENLRSGADERGISLTYMPFVLRACVAALREFPLVNATLDEDAEEIVTKNYYNLGVATATDAGLMVPVIEDVGKKGLLQLATEMNELVERARERTISRTELQGGTFTVTNVGAIGGEYATPIINHPEVAILALGAIEERPRVVEGAVQPRHVLPLSLSFDHRVLDGAVAARFTNAVGRYLEEPTRLLLDG